MSFCVRFDSFVGYLDIFSGLFRFSRIYSNYIGDSAETVALAITSIRCRDIAQACYYYAGRLLESNYGRNVCTMAHSGIFLSSYLVLADWELWGASKVGWFFNSRRQLSISTKCIRYWLSLLLAALTVDRRYEPHLMYTSFRTVCYRFDTWTAFEGNWLKSEAMMQ